MNKKILLLISLTHLLSLSCKKEKDCGKNETCINNPTSYILKRQIWTGPTTNGSSFLYVYNSEHLVSRIERYYWGTYSVDGGPLQTWRDTTYSVFEYTNGLCTKWSFDEGVDKGYFLYEYNQKKLPVKRTLYYIDDTVQFYSFYKYDTWGNLIEKTDSSTKLGFRYVFTYNSNNNLTSVTRSNGQEKEKYEWLGFDDKVNFIKAVNGLPLTFMWDNNYHSYSSSSPNNFLAYNHYRPVNVHQPFDSPTFLNYSYQYNEAGLPTQMLYGPWLVIFEYEKYR